MVCQSGGVVSADNLHIWKGQVEECSVLWLRWGGPRWPRSIGIYTFLIKAATLVVMADFKIKMERGIMEAFKMLYVN